MALYPYIGITGAELSNPVCLSSPLDSIIPINIYFIVPYLLYLLFPCIGILLAFRKDISIKSIYSLYTSFIALLIVSYGIYLFYPTTAACVMVDSSNSSTLSPFSYEILQALYSTSVPYGAFPSYHVTPLVLISFYLYRYWRYAFWIGLPLMLGASWGTVALKFHVILDPIGGLALGLAGQFLIHEKYVEPWIERLFKYKNRLRTNSLARAFALFTGWGR
jgi:hypothetical protein